MESFKEILQKLLDLQNDIDKAESQGDLKELARLNDMIKAIRTALGIDV